MAHIPSKVLQEKLEKARQLVRVGERYRHYRGDEYVVIELALQEETAEVCVVYKNLANHLIWVRGLANWQSTVKLENGQTVARFERYSPK
jgi:hypothetical protein